MTEQELKELREWSAESVMGWVEHLTPIMGDHPLAIAWNMNNGRLMAQNDWRPDTDLNQCFMVVERMRELGFMLYLIGPVWEAKFIQLGDYRKDGSVEHSETPALAILLAAKAAMDNYKYKEEQ